jgi:hypothetical protein
VGPHVPDTGGRHHLDVVIGHAVKGVANGVEIGRWRTGLPMHAGDDSDVRRQTPRLLSKGSGRIRSCPRILGPPDWSEGCVGESLCV